jgi:hypothetical protein
MRSIAQIIHDVIDNTDAADIGSQVSADRLSEELIVALERAGYATTEHVQPPQAVASKLQGRALLHLESKPTRDGEYGEMDMAAQATVWLVPNFTEAEHRGDPDRFESYDVWMHGHSVQLEEFDPGLGPDAHMVMRLVSPE